MLELKGIHKYYNPGTVNEMCLFQDFNLTIDKGEFVSVVGSNGSGKTSMLNIICGSIPVEGGQILINGSDITKQKEYKRNQRIGRVYQNPAMGTCPSMTILENMALADNKTHGTTTASASTPIPAKTPQFVFTNYGIDLNHADLKEYPQHFLGDRIARKLYATQKVYVRRHTATVGFTDNTMEIYKPAIYNSVMKLDSYFKKAVRRQEINEQTATAELSKCLDAAFVAYYEEETGELEKALKKAKSPEEILTVFNSILIKE